MQLYKPDIVPGIGSLYAVVDVVETETARQEQEGWEHEIYRGHSASDTTELSECL